MDSMKKITPFIVFLAISFYGYSQIEDQPLDSVAEKMIMVEGDSVFQSSIALDEVYLFGKLKFPGKIMLKHVLTEHVQLK